MQTSEPPYIWRIAEAEGAAVGGFASWEEEGPQRIGTRKTFVVVPEKDWEAREKPRMPLGKWLVENMPRGTNLEIPRERGSRREIPFIDEDAE